MENHDLAKLLNRAADAIGNPADPTDIESLCAHGVLINELKAAAEEVGRCGMMMYVGGIRCTCVRLKDHALAHDDGQGHTWTDYCGEMMPGSVTVECMLFRGHAGKHRSGHGTEWENEKSKLCGCRHVGSVDCALPKGHEGSHYGGQGGPSWAD